mmetsp:Transcript_70262/g.141529  ORF Transcript_70262/g.141529 Transcript_70262/m.141529 type:complete len:220 (-) Transcript_70262:6-665(-)
MNVPNFATMAAKAPTTGKLSKSSKVPTRTCRQAPTAEPPSSSARETALIASFICSMAAATAASFPEAARSPFTPVFSFFADFGGLFSVAGGTPEEGERGRMDVSGSLNFFMSCSKALFSSMLFFSTACFIISFNSMLLFSAACFRSFTSMLNFSTACFNSARSLAIFWSCSSDCGCVASRGPREMFRGEMVGFPLTSGPLFGPWFEPKVSRFIFKKFGF